MKTSLSTLLSLLLAPVLTTLVSGHAAAADAGLSHLDKSFVKHAAMGGMLEVELGKVAASQGVSQDVKDFGSKMVTDHSKANDELKAIATSKSLEVPAQLDLTHQKMVDDMKSKSGAAFDKAYVNAMVKDHTEDNALFMKEANSGKDADLKAFASKTDETVKMHLQMIKDIKSKMK